MIVAEPRVWTDERHSVLTGLKAAYRAMIPHGLPDELSRVVTCLERPYPQRRPAGKLALVAGADGAARSKAGALLEETSLGVVECASAEAALAVLVREADRTVFLLADGEMAGPRDAESLADTVRKLWPGVRVALSCGDEAAPCRTDEDGVARLGRPWRGLDLLIQAERALAAAP